MDNKVFVADFLLKAVELLDITDRYNTTVLVLAEPIETQNEDLKNLGSTSLQTYLYQFILSGGTEELLVTPKENGYGDVIKAGQSYMIGGRTLTITRRAVQVSCRTMSLVRLCKEVIGKAQDNISNFTQNMFKRKQEGETVSFAAIAQPFVYLTTGGAGHVTQCGFVFANTELNYLEQQSTVLDFNYKTVGGSATLYGMHIDLIAHEDEWNSGQSDANSSLLE